MTTNAQIADHLKKISQLFTIKNDAWKASAFARGADSVLGEQEQVTEKNVMKIDGVGKSLGATITEFINTGSSAKYNVLAEEIDPSCLTMLAVKGIGPKTAHKFYTEGGIKNLDELVAAWEAGKIDPRFDEAMKQALENKGARVVYYIAKGLADTIQAELEKSPDIQRLQTCGSFRRRLSTVKDLDFVVSLKPGTDSAKIIETFCGLGKVINKGETKAAIWYTLGGVTMQADFLVVPDESFGAAIQYFTGSKDHNIEVRGLAQKMGYKVNEYGIFKGDEKVGGLNEEDIYNILNIPMPKPEER